MALTSGSPGSGGQQLPTPHGAVSPKSPVQGEGCLHAWSHKLCDSKQPSSQLCRLLHSGALTYQRPGSDLSHDGSLCPTKKPETHQIGEIIAILSSHQPAGVTEASDILDVRLQAWGVALQDDVDESGQEIVS